MKAFIGVLCALLIATAHCQQMASLENCLYNLGLLTADLSVVFRDRSNLQNKQNALAHLNSLNQQCSFALNSLGGNNGSKGSFGYFDSQPGEFIKPAYASKKEEY